MLCEWPMIACHMLTTAGKWLGSRWTRRSPPSMRQRGLQQRSWRKRSWRQRSSYPRLRILSALRWTGQNRACRCPPRRLTLRWTGQPIDEALSLPAAQVPTSSTTCPPRRTPDETWPRSVTKPKHSRRRRTGRGWTLSLQRREQPNVFLKLLLLLPAHWS